MRHVINLKLRWAAETLLNHLQRNLMTFLPAECGIYYTSETHCKTLLPVSKGCRCCGKSSRRMLFKRGWCRKWGNSSFSAVLSHWGPALTELCGAESYVTCIWLRNGWYVELSWYSADRVLLTGDMLKKAHTIELRGLILGTAVACTSGAMLWNVSG